MRTTTMVVAALVGGILMGLTVSGHAQDPAAVADDPVTFLGTVPARTYTHTYKMPLDVNVDRDWTAAQRIDEERQLVLIPSLYGSLINVTPHGDSVVMWFRDEEGIVRNAVLPEVTKKLLNIERAPARHINYSYR